ncbi:MAG: hypothetical protein HUK02_06470 [Bacteroidaceae bacterium]|nr:hypothetical protein [Bacteroidaceae bacterium]
MKQFDNETAKLLKAEAGKVAKEHNIPVQFVKTYLEDFTDEDTGEVIQIIRSDYDYTANDPELITKILKYMTAIQKRIARYEESTPAEAPIEDYDIEIYFTRDSAITTSTVECEEASSPELISRFIIKVCNEESRRDEVLNLLKERFPEQKWRKFNYDAIINYEM